MSHDSSFCGIPTPKRIKRERESPPARRAIKQEVTESDDDVVCVGEVRRRRAGRGHSASTVAQTDARKAMHLNAVKMEPEENRNEEKYVEVKTEPVEQRRLDESVCEEKPVVKEWEQPVESIPLPPGPPPVASLEQIEPSPSPPAEAEKTRPQLLTRLYLEPRHGPMIARFEHRHIPLLSGSVGDGLSEGEARDAFARIAYASAKCRRWRAVYDDITVGLSVDHRTEMTCGVCPNKERIVTGMHLFHHITSHEHWQAMYDGNLLRRADIDYWTGLFAQRIVQTPQTPAYVQQMGRWPGPVVRPSTRPWQNITRREDRSNVTKQYISHRPIRKEKR